MDARVITAKVRAPRPRVDVVARARLLDRLDDDGHRVVLLSAPAGFGKTVLIVDWLRRSQRPTAWLSIDSADNDPPRFFAHLAAALGTLGSPRFRRAEEVLDRLSRTSGEGAAAALLPALAEGDPRTVIILDDVHHLEDPTLLELLNALMTGLSTGPRLGLLTRVDPAIPLGRLRLSGELLEIRERDLRFTRTEAAELFRGFLPRGLAPDLVARLEERTEGWPAGLRMAAAVLERSDDHTAAVDAFTGSHQLMVDYLLEEVVAGQDAALQRFLMETSILPRFTADACLAVTGGADAGRHLRTVHDANLFLVSLDDRHEWYRYHHLFAELTKFRLQRLLPDRVEALHERASRWFEDQGDLQEALSQAGEMADSRRLLELLDMHGYSILARSEYSSFARWLDRVPDPSSQPYPMFLAALAWFRARAERTPDLPALVADLERAVAQPAVGYPEENLREARLHLDAFRAFALRVTGRYDESIELAERALERLPPDATTIRGVLEFNLGAVHRKLGNMGPARRYIERGYESSLRGGRPYLILASLGHLGAIAAQTEGLDAARQRLDSAIAFAEDQGLSHIPAFAIILYQLAQVYLFADDRSAARSLLERALEITREERESEIRANVLVRLARVEIADGRTDRAAELLAAATALAHAHNVELYATTLDVERTRLAEARSGRLQTPDSAPLSAEVGHQWSLLREAETVLQLQHCLKLGLRDEARALAEKLRAESEPRGRGVALCVALLGGAAVEEDARERRAALTAGLELATRNGYVRPLIDCGQPMRALLESAAAGPLPRSARAFVRDQVLPRFPGSAEEPVRLAPDADRSTLTEREIETLARLASGMSNEAIAQEMFVSINTVKTHLRHVFDKLEVSTRTAAVERARLLGLIDPAGD